MISIAQAREIVLEHSTPLDRTERVTVAGAAGRRLASDVHADGDLPPFDRVMMDGFAVRAADTRPGVVLPVATEVPAGAPGDQSLEPGTAHAIMTGAPLPPGADAVIQVEWTEAVEGGVRLEQAVRPGQNVAPQGEDLKAGAPVASSGDVVSSLSLSLLIASGVSELQVRSLPRVAVLTSGDELVAPGMPLRRGQIRESNGPALAALLSSCGAEVENLGVARDTREELAARFEQALEADIVVLTGGSSVGRYDFSAEVAESFGATAHFDRIAVKPGKPTLFYTRGATLVFCLPGNPVAALMTGRVLVAPAVRRLRGDDVAVWAESERPLVGDPVRRNSQRDLLVPVRRRGEGVAFEGWHGSGDLTCMARADAFGFVERGEGHAPAGTSVPLFPMPARTAW